MSCCFWPTVRLEASEGSVSYLFDNKSVIVFLQVMILDASLKALLLLLGKQMCLDVDDVEAEEEQLLFTHTAILPTIDYHSNDVIAR